MRELYDAPAESRELSAEERARVIAGRYEIVERLGAGGMGQVLLVRHRRLGKAFALKLMQAEFSSDPEAEQIFHREARLASHLSHPSIVAMVDFGYDPDWGWFIVMEYLEGEPLSKRIEQLGTLPIPAACEVALQLAQALEHSHAKGVVHTDLKSENVLCLDPAADQEQRRWQVKLLDFGTAQLASAVSGGTTDRITGTPEYVAPERAAGGAPTPSVDLYAVGVILYEMLVGAPPFVGEPADVLRRHLTELPEPAGARRGEVLDARLDAILDRTLAKDPAARFPTAQALGDELRAYLDVLGVRQRAGLLPAEATAPPRADAAAAAFDALGLPAAGLRRDGTIVIANPAFARLLRAEDPRALEGTSAYRTQLLELNPELQDDLRVVALNGEVVRRDLIIPHGDREVTLRYLMTPAAGACGHCMLVLHVRATPSS